MSRPQATREQYLTALFADEIVAMERSLRWKRRAYMYFLGIVLLTASAFVPPLLVALFFLPKIVKSLAPSTTHSLL